MEAAFNLPAYKDAADIFAEKEAAKSGAIPAQPKQ
jgi:hypothetical protein